MHFEQELDAEDLSPGEVAHLCILLKERPDLSAEEARAELEPLKKAMRGASASGQRGLFADRDAAINLKRFKQLLTILSTLMRIDLPYIISHMQWQRTRVFEMTKTLALTLLVRVGHKGYYRKPKTPKAHAKRHGKHKAHEDASPEEDFSVLEEKFDE